MNNTRRSFLKILGIASLLPIIPTNVFKSKENLLPDPDKLYDLGYKGDIAITPNGGDIVIVCRTGEKVRLTAVTGGTITVEGVRIANN